MAFKRIRAFCKFWPHIMWLLPLGLLFWGINFLDNPLFFPIRSVQIKAAYQHINPEELQQVIAPYAQKSFFGVSFAALKKRLLQIPWVGGVDLARSWPDKIIVDLKEQVAVARWNRDSLLSGDAQIFTPEDKSSLPTDLPQLIGADGYESEMLQYYYKFHAELIKIGVSINSVILTPDKSWRLLINNGTTIFLGRLDIVQRLARFVKAYPQVIGSHGENLGQVDLRYEHGFAIKWRK